MKQVDWRRWQGWRGHVTYWRGWLAWQVYRPMPVHIMPSWSYLWLLPYVGDYAYWDDAIAIMNEERGA